MVFNPRKFEVPDGSITVNKLADGAVTEPKLADAGVTTTKLANAAVTIAKSVGALARKDMVGSEVLLSHTGTTRKRLERVTFLKTALNKVKTLHITVSIMRSAGTGNATVEAWVNNDADWDVNDIYTGVGSPSASAITVSATTELKTLEVDVTALAIGLHVLNLAAINADASTGLSTDFRNYFGDPED